MRLKICGGNAINEATKQASDRPLYLTIYAIAEDKLITRDKRIGMGMG
jgi:hypothetical protein